MNKRPNKAPELSELQELTQLLMILFESATRLPPGPEKQAAIRTINQYQERIAAFVHEAVYRIPA